VMWKPFSALPNYLGGKRRLCPVIFREIAKIYPTRTWPDRIFLDPFMGGGSVALYAKAQGFNVRANDLARRAYLVGKGIVENSSIRITDQDLGLLFAQRNGYDHLVEENFVPHCFTTMMAQFLDLALANLREADLEDTHQALLYVSLIQYMTRARAGGQFTNRKHMIDISRGDFDAMTPGFRRNISVRAAITPPAVRMRHIQRAINAGIFAGNAQVFQENALTWMPEREADLVYLDPPYFGSSSYEGNYWILDCILAGRLLPKSPPSPFNRRKTALVSLIQMFEAADHIPLWIFSFADSPDGFSTRQLCELIEDFDRQTEVVPLQHRWSIATTEDHYAQGAKELLIIAHA
jgi:adenine-specific DNA methylase